MALHLPPVTVGPTTKGLACPREQPAARFLAGRPHVLDGSFTFPLLTASDSAIAHNVAELAEYARAHRLQLAPHGKTSMAPALWQRQLDAGAWGISVASGAQLMAARHVGVEQILVANQVVDPAVLRWIATQEWGRIVFYVDSAEGLALAAAHATASRPFEVVVELGHPEGRTGVRTVPDAVALARAVAASPAVRLVGVSGYEGALPTPAAARSFLSDLMSLAGQIVAEGLVEAGSEVIVSAGGSAYFDVVADVLGGAAGKVADAPMVPLLRSGSYVVHDHGFYAQHTPFRRVPGSLIPALRLWAQVSSLPQAGLALVAAGKRDMPFDEGLPIPLRVHRPGGHVQNVEGWGMTRTNDQHGYLEHLGPRHTELRVGDIVELGVSHPCTAFDKWRVVPIVDDDLVAIDLVKTLF